jgi:putative ABC transport system substrate-binding protein
MAKHAVAGTTIPVVFAPVVNPVAEGVVHSISHPGGNVTGIQNGDTLPKALEWLHTIVPQATQVAVLYHPRDAVAQTSIKPLPAIAATLGITLVLHEVHSPAEARAVIATLPPGAALFFVPTPSLEPLGALAEVALHRGIATGSNNLRYLEPGGVSIYGPDFFAMGQQAARLADLILTGTKPADLPVETAEYFLRINLKAATAMGIDIPEKILRQAHAVIR